MLVHFRIAPRFAATFFMAATVVCLVCGPGGLPPEALTMLAGALDRAGVAAALSAGGPAIRGAAPAAAGRNLALCRFDEASGLCVLHPASSAPLDLRRWCLAVKAAVSSGHTSDLETRAHAKPLAAAPQPRAGTSAALAALEALLDGTGTEAPLWLSGTGGRLTLVCAAPTHHVDDDILQPLLEAANGHLLGVCFAALAPPMGDEFGRSVEEELRAKHAGLALAAVLTDADNGAYRAVACTPAAADALALALLFPEREASGVPRVAADICLPAPLLAGGGRRVRASLRPEVLPLHDAVERIKVCRCHGRGLLSRESVIGADDISHMLHLAGKNNVCCVSAKGLSPAEWHPNCLSVGRDAVLHLPSFYEPPFPLAAAGDARAAAAGGAAPVAATFHALACVPVAAISESHLFGIPWVARAADDDEADDDEGSHALAGAGAVTQPVLFAAMCEALAARGSGLLLAAQLNLDTGRQTPFRCLYLAVPATPAPANAAAPHALDGTVDRAFGALADAAGVAGPPPQLLIKRIVAREEVLPPPPAVAAPAVPPAVAEEVARSMAASLPDIAGAFDPLAVERGTHRVLSQLVSKSLAPPPRGALHTAEADANEARERAASRKGSKAPGAGKAKRKGQ